MGFSFSQRRDIILRLRKLRKDKRVSKERLTFQDVEQLVWSLPPSRIERFHDWISNWQGKKNGKQEN